MSSSTRRRTVVVSFAVALLCGCGDSSGIPRDSHGDEDETGGDTYPYICQVELESVSEEPPTLYQEAAFRIPAFRIAEDPGTSPFEDPPAASFAVDQGGFRCRSSFDRIYLWDRGKPEHERHNLNVIVSDREGIVVPGPVMRCALLARSPLTAGDFPQSYFSVEGWDPRIDSARRPDVRVSSVTCVPIEQATTTSSTSTTTLPACEDVDCGEGSRCVDGVCRNVEFGKIEVVLETSDAPLGSVQVQLDYSYSPLRFSRGPGSRTCYPNPELEVLYADCNYYGASCDGAPSLTFHENEMQMGLVSADEIPVPVVLATCDVHAEDLDAALADLRIQLSDSSNEAGELVYARVVVNRVD